MRRKARQKREGEQEDGPHAHTSTPANPPRRRHGCERVDVRDARPVTINHPHICWPASIAQGLNLWAFSLRPGSRRPIVPFSAREPPGQAWEKNALRGALCLEVRPPPHGKTNARSTSAIQRATRRFVEQGRLQARNPLTHMTNGAKHQRQQSRPSGSEPGDVVEYSQKTRQPQRQCKR